MTEQLLRVGYETDTNPELLVLDPRHRAEQMGAIGLTGFTIMEAVESPWEMVRDSMKERVIDQDPAIDAIIEALDASNARSKHDNTPLATFAFLGPSGVGKSETGKTLADVLREGHANLIKIDCSEFSSGHEVANLTGSPLGYVGSTTTPKINKADIEKAGTIESSSISKHLSILAFL